MQQSEHPGDNERHRSASIFSVVIKTITKLSKVVDSDNRQSYIFKVNEHKTIEICYCNLCRVGVEYEDKAGNKNSRKADVST